MASTAALGVPRTTRWTSQSMYAAASSTPMAETTALVNSSRRGQSNRRQTSASASLPAPIVLDAALLANGGTAGALEKYEGNIVRLQNVTVTATTSSDGVSQGWFRVGTGVEVLSDFFYPVDTAPYSPTLDDTFASLTGALKYHYGKYRIVPRDAADFVLAQ